MDIFNRKKVATLERELATSKQTNNNIRLDYGILLAEKSKEKKILEDQLTVLTRINEINANDKKIIERLKKDIELSYEEKKTLLSAKSKNTITIDEHIV